MEKQKSLTVKLTEPLIKELSTILKTNLVSIPFLFLKKKKVKEEEYLSLRSVISSALDDIEHEQEIQIDESVFESIKKEKPGEYSSIMNDLAYLIIVSIATKAYKKDTDPSNKRATN